MFTQVIYRRRLRGPAAGATLRTRKPEEEPLPVANLQLRAEGIAPAVLEGGRVNGLPSYFLSFPCDFL